MNSQPLTISKRWGRHWIWWLGRVCIFIAALGLIIAVRHWLSPGFSPFDSRNFMFHRWDVRLDPAFIIGGAPLLVALLSLLTPGPAGVIGLYFGVVQIVRYRQFIFGLSPATPVPGQALQPGIIRFIPQPLYIALYFIFILGCVICLIMAIRERHRKQHTITATDKGIHLAAGIICLLALIVTIAYFLLAFEAAIGFTFIVGAIIASAIAWLWPSTGGILIVLISVWSLIQMDLDKNISAGINADIRIIYSVLFLIFLTGGILYLLSALRRHKPSTSQASTSSW
jgi:hypothetical protein